MISYESRTASLPATACSRDRSEIHPPLRASTPPSGVNDTWLGQCLMCRGPCRGVKLFRVVSPFSCVHVVPVSPVVLCKSGETQSTISCSVFVVRLREIWRNMNTAAPPLASIRLLLVPRLIKCIHVAELHKKIAHFQADAMVWVTEHRENKQQWTLSDQACNSWSLKAVF